MGGRRGGARPVLHALVTLAPLGVGLLLGCPNGKKKREVRYEVKQLTDEEKAAKKERMKTNQHQQDQLLRQVQRLRGGR